MPNIEFKMDMNSGIVPTYSSRFVRMVMNIADDTDIMKSAYAHITLPESLSVGGIPVSNGLYDIRLGAFGGRYLCGTCHHDFKDCVGHQGYADLKAVVIQPICLPEISKWLKLICFRCGHSIVDLNTDKFKKMSKNERFKIAVENAVSKTECYLCNAPHPKVKAHKDPFKFEITPNVPGAKSIILYPIDVKKIFEKISDSVVHALGRSKNSHPRKYFVTKMVVSPTTIRPYIKPAGAGKGRRQSPLVDFTKYLVKTSMNGNVDDINHSILINSYMYDMVRGGTKGGSKEINAIGGSPSDAIIKTLGGKHGDVRNNLFGHRSLSVSRLVISCDPTIRITELHVPMYVLETLHIAETVCDFNYERLCADVVAGRCSRIKKYNEVAERNITEKMRFTIVLQYGDLIYRSMRKGDIIIFNRQPSLRDSAIGGHRVVPTGDKTVNTYQMHVNACKNYNADFDGDAMGAKPPRTCRSRAEAEYLSSIARHSLSTQHSTFTCGAVLDGVIGSFLLTKSGVELDKLHSMRCFQYCGMNNMPKFDKQMYSGRDIVSIILKPTPISYSGKSSYYDDARKEYIYYDEKDYNIKIVNGVHTSGIIDSKAIGTYNAGSIFHLIAREYSPEHALEAAYNYQQVMTTFATMRGFTISLDDILIDKQSVKQIQEIIDSQIVSSNHYAEQFVRGEIYPPLGSTIREYYEKKQIETLGKSMDVYAHILKSMDTESNGLYQMVYHDAKGSAANFFLIMASVGQVMLMGGRVPDTFSRYRSTVHYPRYSLAPESRGFIKNSFMRGLTHDEMCMAAMGAREQLVRKSQSTAISGAQFRIQIKNLESCITTYHRQVMKSQMMIQQLYGDIGVDPRFLIKENISIVNMNDIALKEAFPMSTPTEIQKLKECRDKYRNSMIALSSIKIIKFSNVIPVPFKISDMVNKAVSRATKPIKNLDATMQMIETYIESLPYIYTNPYQEHNKTKMPEYFKSATFIVQTMIRVHLARHIVSKINEKLVDIILSNITLRYVSTFIDPGVCCGIIAVQSYNEPQVQNMLNALHGKAGGALNAVDRIKEITSMRLSNNRTKTMMLKLNEPYASDVAAAKELSLKLIGITFEICVTDWQIFFEDKPTHPEYKHEISIIEKFEKSNVETRPNDLTKWCLRFELNSQEMMLKMIDLDDIIKVLYDVHPNIYIINTSEISSKLILRIYVREGEISKRSDVEEYICKTFMANIMATHIRGVPDFLNCTLKKEKYVTVDDAGNIKETLENTIHVSGCNHMACVELFNNETTPIDYTEIYTNDILDTFEIFGIEALRMKIYEQLTQQVNIAYAHISIYADAICWSAIPTQLKQHASREKNKTCLKMALHAAGKVLMDSAIIGVNERIDDSISSQIFFGQPPRIGTNYFDCVVDEEFVVSNTKTTKSQMEALAG